jgi:hypothetical protein
MSGNGKRLFRTKDDINKILSDINSHLVMLDEYISMSEKVRFLCKLCGNMVMMTPQVIYKKSKYCNECFHKSQKRTNEDFTRDFYALHEDIELLSKYIDSRKTIKAKCKKCDYEWGLYSKHIDRGCPRCSWGEPHKNENVDRKLNELKIVRLGDVFNGKTKTNFQCLICNYTWESCPDTIFNAKRHCPKCKDMILDNDKVDRVLIEKEKPFIRIDNIVGYDNNIKWKCLTCNNIFDDKPRNIMGFRNVCPICSQTRKLTNGEIKIKLQPRGIVLLDEYENSSVKYNFKCLKCDNIWKSNFDGVYRGSGCPNCSCLKSEKRIKYLILTVFFF